MTGTADCIYLMQRMTLLHIDRYDINDIFMCMYHWGHIITLYKHSISPQRGAFPNTAEMMLAFLAGVTIKVTPALPDN